MALGGQGHVLPGLLSVRAGLHAALDAVLHAVGVLPLRLHDLPLLLLRLLPKLPGGQRARQQTRLRTPATGETLTEDRRSV